MRRKGLVALLFSCLELAVPLQCFPASPAAIEASGSLNAREELLIPPQAQDRALKALNALGPERGAIGISFKSVKIVGVAKSVTFDSSRVQQALRDLGARETPVDIQISLSGDVLFDFDKWDIRPDAEQSLNKVGGIIQAYPGLAVVISGYTDSRGTPEYNRGLSLRRAAGVKKWLAERSGVDPLRMKTDGFGADHPVAPNSNPDGSDNPQGRQKNRRVEIVIKKR